MYGYKWEGMRPAMAYWRYMVVILCLMLIVGCAMTGKPKDK
jgi:hypothetical protein